MSDEEAAVRLGDKDIAKLEEWYKDICGVGNEEARFWKFLGTDPGYGTNHRILGRFFNLKEEDRAKLEYFLKVYMHQAAGDRADDADWTVRTAILVTLVAPSIAFVVDWSVGLMANEAWYSPPLWAAIVWFLAAVTFYCRSNKIMAWFKRKRAKK